MSEASGAIAVEAILDLRADRDQWGAVIGGLRTDLRALLTLQHAGFEKATLVGEGSAQALAAFRRRRGARLDVGVRDEVGEPRDSGSLLFKAPVVFSTSTARALAERAKGRQLEVPSELPRGLPGYLTGASGPAQRAEAGRQVRRACRKPMRQSGIVSAYLLQPIGLQICRVLSRTPITPNMLTIVGFLFGLASLPLLWDGGRVPIAIAAVLLLLSNILDQLDGELARMKFLFSSFGDKLDHTLDDVSKILILVPMGIGLSHATGQSYWMILGWVGAVARLAYVAVLRYYVLQFGEGNTSAANFRFWYKVPQSGEQPPEPETRNQDNRIKARYFLRKDFLYTAYFVFGLLNALWIPFAFTVAGSVVYGALALIQVVFFHRRMSFQGHYQGEV